MQTQPVSPAEFANRLPTPPSVSAAWKTFSFLTIDAPQLLKTAFEDNLLGLHVAGPHRLRHATPDGVFEGRSDPGAVHVIPAGTDLAVESTAPSRALVLFIPPAFLKRTLAESWPGDPGRVEIARRFLIRDPVIESVLRSLVQEAEQGGPSGQLYAESACEFLALHLIHTHSSLAGRAPAARGGLSPKRLRQVLEYIDERFAQSITMRELATLAGVSVRHFERAFRQATGLPPHAFVLKRRVAAARHLLSTLPSLTVDEVARRVGFSSASHLSTAFRRQLGCSPGAFRRAAR